MNARALARVLLDSGPADRRRNPPLRIASLALAFALLIPATASARDDDDDMVELEHEQVVEPRLMRTRPGANAVKVYLNGEGGNLQGGWDNSAENTSALVRGHGFDELDVPAYSGGSKRWRQTIACVRNKLGDFNIEIVTDRPTKGEYIMAMIGGRPDLLGYPRGVSGIAPYSGNVIPQAVVFVFERGMRSDVEGTCTSTVHEVGHALGLEHEYLCEDPMSYLSGCGEKTFQDVNAWCGEYEGRECDNGGKQNTYRHLADTVGLREGAEPRVADRAPEPTDDPEPPTRIERPSADRPPAITVRSPSDDVLGGDGALKILAEVDDPDASVDLLWATPRGNYVMSCEDMPDNIPATCKRKGKLVLFTLQVGFGERAFALRAVDASGNQAVTDVHWLWFE